MNHPNHLLPPDPMVALIRDGKHEQFNTARSEGATINLKGADLGATNLRRFQIEGLDLSDCNLRHADLRGLDLRTCRLEGACIPGARIEGAYFPLEISPEEIRLSQTMGTRMRYGTK